MKITRMLLFFCLMYLHVFSQNIKINIDAPGAQTKIVRLICWSDLITFREKLLAQGVVDSAGHCTLECKLSDTIAARIYVEHYFHDIFLEPKQTFQINFPPFDFLNADDKINPFIDDMRLDATVIEKIQPGLNQWMDSLNEVFNLMTMQNFDAIYYKRQVKLVDTLEANMRLLFEDVKDNYFLTSFRYKFALLRQVANLMSGTKTFAQYFYLQPLFYNNLDYMEFFNQFFENFAISKSKRISFYDVRNTVNKDGTFAALNDTLGKDTLLADEVLREMVMLKGLFECYNNSEFIKANILNIIAETARESKFQQHRTLAENILFKLQHFEKDAPAPDFSLPLASGEKISLQTFSGKYVYLFFFTTWSDACIGQMSVLNKYAEKYADSIKFVGISLDRNPLKFDYFLKENHYNWTLLHFADNYSFLNAYGVRTFPFAVMIDPKGRIFSYPAEKPSEKLEIIFNGICAPRKK
ncbi:MAG: TlpA disulfide reductase family protein [Bacteroidota bacterium]